MSANAIGELRAAFDEPFASLGREATRDRTTVLISWPSVPVEVVHAAGFTPVFARGHAAPTPAADRFLEPELFPNRLRQLVEAALTGRLADVAAIVLPRSSDPDYKCFLYLRELERRGIAAEMPPILLFDLLHTDDAGARAYNVERARDLHARLASLAMRRHEADAVRDAIQCANHARSAARRLNALRNDPPRVTGADALPLLGAFWQVEPKRYASLADEAANTLAREAPLEGPRVLLAGAPVDVTTLHAAIEAEGGTVVAEISPYGACGIGADVETVGDPYAALSLHYGRESIDARLPVASLMRKLDGLLETADAVVVSQPNDDGSFGWDYPRLRELLAQRSMPHAVLRSDPALAASEPDLESIRSLLPGSRARPEAHRG